MVLYLSRSTLPLCLCSSSTRSSKLSGTRKAFFFLFVTVHVTRKHRWISVWNKHTEQRYNNCFVLTDCLFFRHNSLMMNELGPQWHHTISCNFEFTEKKNCISHFTEASGDSAVLESSAGIFCLFSLFLQSLCASLSFFLCLLPLFWLSARWSFLQMVVLSLPQAKKVLVIY